MKALMASAVWDPKPGYALTEQESKLRRANCGSQVWRNPSFSLEDVPVPEISDTQVLARVKRCGICGSDSHIYKTDEDGYIVFSGPAKLPCIIGHEYSGVVEQVGKNVSNFQPGDSIAAESIVWCGKCTPCRSGSFNQCSRVELTGITMDGALAEYAAVDELQCWDISSLSSSFSDEGMFDIASLIEPLGCAYNGIFVSGGGFRPGSVVTVYGVGPIGLGAVALSRIAGASLIIAFDPIPERLNIAKQLGADYVYNSIELQKTGTRSGDLVKEHTRGRGAEMQVEAAGAARQTIPEMEYSLAPNGKIVYLGRAATDTPILLDTLVTGANAIVGARGHSGYGIYSNVIRLLASGRLLLGDIITSRYSFADALLALERSVRRTDGKILVRIS